MNITVESQSSHQLLSLVPYEHQARTVPPETLINDSDTHCYKIAVDILISNTHDTQTGERYPQQRFDFITQSRILVILSTDTCSGYASLANGMAI
jgi:hypothetical protein